MSTNPNDPIVGEKTPIKWEAQFWKGGIEPTEFSIVDGLTKREYFLAQIAVAAFPSWGPENQKEACESRARDCLIWVDALIAELNKTGETK